MCVSVLNGLFLLLQRETLPTVGQKLKETQRNVCASVSLSVDILSVMQYELENILSALLEVRPVHIYVDTCVCGGVCVGGVRKRPFLFFEV